MFRFYYQWRYKRRQRAGAFKLPSVPPQGDDIGLNLGNYLSQPSVRGRDFSRFDIPRNTYNWIKWFALLGSIAGFSWLVYESFSAMVLFH